MEIIGTVTFVGAVGCAFVLAVMLMVCPGQAGTYAFRSAWANAAASVLMVLLVVCAVVFVVGSYVVHVW